MEEEQETLSAMEIQALIVTSLRGLRVNVLDLVTVFTLVALTCVKRLDGDKEEYLKAISEIWEEVPVFE